MKPVTIRLGTTGMIVIMESEGSVIAETWNRGVLAHRALLDPLTAQNMAYAYLSAADAAKYRPSQPQEAAPQ